MKHFFLVMLFTWVCLVWSVEIDEKCDHDLYLNNEFNTSLYSTQQTIYTTNEMSLGNYAIASSILFLSFLSDLYIRDFVQSKVYSGDSFITDFLYGVGSRESFFYKALVLYSADNILQDSYLHDTLILSLHSMLVTQGITEGFKKTFKRARPRNSPNDSFDFWVKGESFFSGHSSGTWAYVAVFADRYPSTKWLLYSVASSVSLSRIYEDAHWTSDVLLGAFVGYSIGKMTLKMNLRYADKINVLPYIDLGEKYVLVQWRF